MIKGSNKLMLISGIIIVLFFSFWKVNEFPQDVNGEVIIYANTLRCLQWAHNQKKAPQDCFQKEHDNWANRGLATKDYELTAFVRKLWLSILSVFFNIFGYSVLSITLSSLFVSLITIFFTFKLGRLLYSEEAGIIASIFLATSLLYNMTVRAGYCLIMPAAISVVVCYYLYKYLESNIYRYLIISGILLGIGSLDAIPNFFLLPFSIVLILLFDFPGKKQNKIRVLINNFKNLMIIFFWALVTSLFFSALYARYYNTNIFSIYNSIYTWAIQRLPHAQYSSQTHQFLNSSIIESLKYAFIFLKNVFISMSPLNLDDYALQVEGIPMITVIVSVYFIIGLAAIFRNRSKADNLVLIFLGVNFIIYMFLLRVQTRYIAAFLPFICITSAYGVVKLACGINLGRYSNSIRQFVYALVIFFVSYIGYKNFFILYKGNDANLRRFYNNSKIAEFVVKNSNPRDYLVILAENLFSCRDAVIFNMKYKPYEVVYLEEILYNKSQAYGRGQITVEEIKESIKQLESDVLSKNRKIYYIFSEHSIDYYFPAMVPDELYPYVRMFKEIFLTLHPGIEPVEVLHYSNGDPTHSIFLIK